MVNINLTRMGHYIKCKIFYGIKKQRLIYKVRLNYILFMSPTLQGYRYVKTERMEEDVHAHNK